MAVHRFWGLPAAGDGDGCDGCRSRRVRGAHLRRGGALRWAERELVLRPASAWRERYALAEGDSELALFDGAGWGRRPVKVTLDDPGALDAGLLLFTAFVVRRLAEDAGSSAAATTSSTAATGG